MIEFVLTLKYQICPKFFGLDLHRDQVKNLAYDANIFCFGIQDFQLSAESSLILGVHLNTCQKVLTWSSSKDVVDMIQQSLFKVKALFENVSSNLEKLRILLNKQINVNFSF